MVLLYRDTDEWLVLNNTTLIKVPLDSFKPTISAEFSWTRGRRNDSSVAHRIRLRSAPCSVLVQRAMASKPKQPHGPQMRVIGE